MSKIKSSAKIRIYDLPLNRFTNVALPLFLQQLQQHKNNLNKHKINKDWDKVRTEQIKGQQIASQLEAAIRELEEVGQHLSSEDEREFADKIKPFKSQALAAVKDFKLYSEESSYISHSLEKEETKKLELSQALILPEEIEVEKRKTQLESFENLQKDIEDLHDLFSEFSQQVHAQGTQVNNIEENVETALENVIEGQSNLAKAAKFKAAMYPITGALIGTCIGGPVGLLAGLKIGGLAALGGTVLGFAGGSGLKKWHQSVVNESAENLTKSQSTPNDLGNASKSETLPKSLTFSHSSPVGLIDTEGDSLQQRKNL